MNSSARLGQIVFNHAAKDFGVIRRFSKVMNGHTLAVVDMPNGPAIVSTEILRAATTDELSSLTIKYVINKVQNQAARAVCIALASLDAPEDDMIV